MGNKSSAKKKSGKAKLPENTTLLFLASDNEKSPGGPAEKRRHEKMLHGAGQERCSSMSSGGRPASTRKEKKMLQAAKSGKLKVLEKMASDHDVDFAVEDEFGRQASHLSAQRGKVKALKLLLEAGVDVNAQSSPTGRTAAHYACATANVEALQVLQEHGLDWTIRDVDGKTAHDLAYESFRTFGGTTKHLDTIEVVERLSSMGSVKSGHSRNESVPSTFSASDSEVSGPSEAWMSGAQKQDVTL